MTDTGAVWHARFGSPRTKLVHQKTYATRAQAQLALFEYIEMFYNRKRRHSTLGD